MADISKTVEIVFGGKNDLTKVINQVSGEFSSLNTVVDQVTGPLAGAALSIEKIDATLLALAIGGMAYAIKQSSEFNKSFALISTSVTATGGDLEQFRTDILEYATGSVKSLEDINAALYTAAQAGIDYTHSLEFLAAAEQLAVANNANLNTTVDLLTATMNSYGFTIEDVGHLNDVFFQSTLIGKQTIDDLGASMGQVVGIAASSGVSFEDLSAAIATLTAKGMTTPNAITAIKAAIATIISPSKEAADAAKALGLNFSLTELQSKGFAGMLAEIMEKTGGSQEKMVGLFSEVRAMNGVLSLTGDSMKFFNSALDEIVHSSGAAEAAYQKMVATFSNQLQTIMNVAKTTMISIGTELEPTAAGIAGSFATMLAGVKIGVDAGAFDPLFDYLEQVGGELATWFRGIGEALPEALSGLDFTSLIAAFNDLSRAISDYFGGLDLTKADDLGSALQTVVDILAGLMRITTGMADAFRPFLTTIVEFFKTIAGGGAETQKTMGQILAFSQAIQALGLGIVGAVLVIDEYKLSITGMFNIIAGGAQVMWNGLQIVFEGIKGGFIILAGSIITLLDSLTFGLIPGLDTAKEKLTEWGSKINFSQDAEESRQGLFRMMEGFVQLGTETETSTVKADRLREGLLKIPETTRPEIELVGGDKSAIDAVTVKTAIEDIPEEKSVGIEVLADGSTIEQANGLITQTFPDGRVIITNVGVETNAANLTDAKNKIKDALPDKKTMEIEAKLDIEKIKAQADIIQTTIEWKAKFDIAEAEAEAKKFESIVESISSTIESTGNLMSDLFGYLNESQGKGTTSLIERMIAEENKRREAALELQKDLTEATIEQIKARTRALTSGQALIEIDGAGLQPHLEAFMFEILEAIQIKANQEGAEFLIGL